MTKEEKELLLKDLCASMNETSTPCPVSYGKVDCCNKNHFDYRGLIPMGIVKRPKICIK
jgi:hypothetical protein